MDDKPSLLPSVVYQPEVDRNGSNNEKSRRSHRKYVMICVITAMLIIGVLVGFKFLLDNTSEIIRLESENGHRKSNNEDALNTRLIDLADDGNRKIRVVEDVSRNVRVIKASRRAGTICFVATLNINDSTLYDAVLHDDDVEDDMVETQNRSYEISEAPVGDVSTLGRPGQDLCNNLDVYWLTEAEDLMTDDATADAGRQKRAACSIPICKHKKKCSVFGCKWKLKCRSRRRYCFQPNCPAGRW